MSLFVECILTSLLTFSICFVVGTFVARKHKER